MRNSTRTTPRYLSLSQKQETCQRPPARVLTQQQLLAQKQVLIWTRLSVQRPPIPLVLMRKLPFVSLVHGQQPLCLPMHARLAQRRLPPLERPVLRRAHPPHRLHRLLMLLRQLQRRPGGSLSVPPRALPLPRAHLPHHVPPLHHVRIPSARRGFRRVPILRTFSRHGSVTTPTASVAEGRTTTREAP
jgi:hypothetical protein